jgi:signal transduction histidine kinase
VVKVVRRYELSANEKGLELEWIEDASCKEVRVLATPESLDRVFNNLVSNAVKYTPPDGRVTVSLVCMEEEASVTIADTGIGITSEAMEHLFEEFYRAPNAKEMEREGTGLGLTIVKDTVTRLGGHISVDSKPGGGSRFTVTLPIYEESAEAGTGEMPEKSATVAY